jgi:hypothetical protein
MENPVANTVSEAAAAKAPANSGPETEPIFLALPRPSAQPENEGDASKGWLERLHLIETEGGPKVEQSLLVEMLNRSSGFPEYLADPAEVQNYHNPFASLNAYKHRIQAIRCEFVNAHLRAESLALQLAESRSAIQRLEQHTEYLRFTLEQMQASRAWKLLEKCSGWRRAVSQLIGRILGPSGPGGPSTP